MSTHRSPGTFHPPTADGLAADQQRRTHQLEQRPQPQPAGPTCQVTATNAASLVGATSVETGRWWPWRGGLRLQYIIATATGVTGTTTVNVLRSGVAVVTLSFAADGVIREGHDLTWTPGQYLELNANGDALHLVVQLHFAGEGSGGLVFTDPSGIQN